MCHDPRDGITAIAGERSRRQKVYIMEKHSSHWAKETDLVLFRGEVNLCETAELLPIFYRFLDCDLPTCELSRPSMGCVLS